MNTDTLPATESLADAAPTKQQEQPAKRNVNKWHIITADGRVEKFDTKQQLITHLEKNDLGPDDVKVMLGRLQNLGVETKKKLVIN